MRLRVDPAFVDALRARARGFRLCQSQRKTYPVLTSSSPYVSSASVPAGPEPVALAWRRHWPA
jgi:hypothetical protein